MSTKKLQLYEAPMCCATGVCGPNVNPELVRFASELDGLAKQGLVIDRFSLSSHPGAFAQQTCVRNALSEEGISCLPLLVDDGIITIKGRYPSKSELITLNNPEQ